MYYNIYCWIFTKRTGTREIKEEKVKREKNNKKERQITKKDVQEERKSKNEGERKNKRKMTEMKIVVSLKK